MNLTPRQMLILVILIVGFGIAAFVVSRDEDDAEFDRALWCSKAAALESTGGIFRGTAPDASVADIEAAKLALFDVETLAPFDIWDDIATLADFTLIVGQQRAGNAWPDAFTAARENKAAEIDAAFAAVDTELTACGLRFG